MFIFIYWWEPTAARVWTIFFIDNRKSLRLLVFLMFLSFDFSWLTLALVCKAKNTSIFFHIWKVCLHLTILVCKFEDSEAKSHVKISWSCCSQDSNSSLIFPDASFASLRNVIGIPPLRDSLMNLWSLNPLMVPRACCFHVRKFSSPSLIETGVDSDYIVAWDAID